MPELPEVESVKLQLQKYLVGHKIGEIITNYSKIFIGDKRKILGASILRVRRFAKVLVLDLSNKYSIVIQIKMTGQLIYRGPNLTLTAKGFIGLSKKVVGGVPGKHTHVIFKLDRGGILYYNDVRKFGKITVVKTQEVEKTGLVGKLGPEPQISIGSIGQVVLTIELFKNILSKSARPVKLVIMDQAKIGGVGNIYANDALWLAAINPRRSANSLSLSEMQNLYNAIHTVLKAGLKYGGASELAFVTPDGGEGNYQDHSLVYGHEGEVCKRCKKSKITKYFLSGRGTYWCSECQK